MFSKDHFINNISLAVTAFISGIYFFKYISIYIGVWSFVITVAYLIAFIILFIGLDRIHTEKFMWLTRRKLALIISFIIICAFVYITFVPRFGRIGRLPAIADWLDRLFAGKYPYNSAILPSGFPVLFFLSIPFYLIKNIGYLEVLGLGIFLFLILNTSKSPKENIVKLVIALICPVIMYEVVVRSELLGNMALTIMIILLAEKYLDEEKLNLKFFLFAILFGLVLSTRSVVGLTYIIYLPYKFRYELLKGAAFTIIIITAFLLTLIPFIAWNSNAFFLYGPFAVQSIVSFIPMWLVMLVIVAALITSWGVSDIQEVFFASGIFLFLPAFFSMVHKFFAFGAYNSIVFDRFDISYLIFCMPFFILSLKDYKVDKFLRKVLED